MPLSRTCSFAIKYSVRLINRTGYAFNLNKGKSTDGATVIRIVVLQLVLLLKNQMNASRLLSIPQSGGKMSKRLGRIIGCKYKTSVVVSQID